MTTATLAEKERQLRIEGYNERAKYPCLPLTPEQQRLMSENTRLVYGYVNRKMKYVHGQDREEATSYLFPFLLRAAQTYDPLRGVKFSTWADQWFEAGRSKWHQDQMKAARIPTNRVSEMTKEECDGVYFGLPDAKVVKPGRDAEIHDSIEQYRKHVREPRRWRILELRYGEGLSLSQIGAEFTLSKERVRQLIESTLRQIRSAVRAEKIGQKELIPEPMYAEVPTIQYLGRCPRCRRLIMWCGSSTLRAEAAGLLIEEATAERVRDKKWGHGAGCKRKKKGKRRVEKTMFDAMEN